MTLPERSADFIEPEGPDLAAMRSAIDELVDGRFKVEILGGEIIVSPLARTLHDIIVSRLHAAFARTLDEDVYQVSQRVEFLVDESNSPQPDLAVMDAVLRDDTLDATEYAPEDAFLVVEVTSPSNAPSDRKWGLKYKAYAKGLVPIYLLIDAYAQDGPSVTLFTDPTGTRYRSETLVPFGKKLSLPEPFDAVVIDTSTFPTPSPAAEA